MAKRKARNDVVLRSFEYYPDKNQNREGEYHPTQDDYKYMRRAIKVARTAIGKDTPVGVVGVHPRSNRVWDAHSMDHITGDPRDHAENVLLDRIMATLRENDPQAELDLSEFNIYTTVRCCPRCAQSMSDCHAGLILCAATQEESDLMRDRDISAHDMWADAGRRLTVVEGLLAVEAAELVTEQNRAPHKLMDRSGA